VAVEAGRLTLARLDTLEAQGKSYAFEATLASQSLVRRLERLRSAGYTIHVAYLWLPTVDLARVAERSAWAATMCQRRPYVDAFSAAGSTSSRGTEDWRTHGTFTTRLPSAGHGSSRRVDASRPPRYATSGNGG
jgi:hypothetical protein